MRSVLHFIILTAWALWLGGVVACFVFALNLFNTHRDIAGEANSAMFVVFGKYELVLAAVALAAAGLTLVTYPSKPIVILVATLVISGAMGTTAGLGLTPRMEILRTENKTHTDEFKTLHKKSMMAMVMQTGMLLLSGGVLLRVVKHREPIALSNDPLPTILQI